MSIRKPLPSIAALAVCAALTAPLLSAKDKAVPPVDDPYAEVDLPESMPPMVHRGYGQGSISLPTVAEDGELVGVLCDCDGPGDFRLHAQLTGCIPIKKGASSPRYWYGGLYGQMVKLSDPTTDYGSHTVAYYVEGVWSLDKFLTGHFEAQLWRIGPDGIPFVAGLMDGKFCVHPLTAEEGDEPWSGAAQPGKDVKNPYGDARSGPPWRDAAPDKVKDAYGDASSPPKVGKTRYRDAQSGPPWRDAAPDRVKDAFGDAVSNPTKDAGKGPYRSVGTARPWDGAWVPTPKDNGGPTQWAEAVIDKPAPPWTDVRPGHKGYDDVVSQPVPVLVGNFGARFGCFCE